MYQRTFALEFRLTIRVGMPRLVRVKMRLRVRRNKYVRIQAYISFLSWEYGKYIA